MTQRTYCALLMTISVLPISVAAQTGDLEGSEPETPGVSSPFAGATAGYEPELARTNYLDLGFSTKAMFDDNVLNAPSNLQSELSCVVAPYIGIRQSRGRLDWKTSYTGGFTIHQKFDTYNQGTHDFEGQLSYKLAPHLDLSVSDRFLKMSGIFNALQAQAPSTTSLLQQPNQSVVTPIADQSSNVAGVGINDQFSATSAVGGSASFLSLRFGQRPVGVQLFDANSQEAEGYYNRRISTRNLLGIMYRFQRFTFTPNGGDTSVNAVLATYEIAIQKHTTMTLFAGPQYIDSTATAGAGSRGAGKNWNPVAGASFEFNGVKRALTASISRTASDGGGLLNSSVNLTEAAAMVRLRFAKNWSGEFGGDYGQSDAIGASIASFSSLRSTTGRFRIDRQIAMWTVGVAYARIFQSENTRPNGNADVRHNTAWLSVAYQFSRALGRD